MFSFLIPVQNYAVHPLVEDLVRQGREAQVDFEVLVAEDGSNSDFIEKNATLTSFPEVKQLVSEQDIGRAAIRNYLADQASGEYLVFIDADSGLPEQYIAMWQQHIGQAPVLVGGTRYALALQNPEESLRWTYGRAREEVSAKERNRNPHRSLTANNLFVEKAVFENVRFDASITEYGHEDTLFGKALYEAGVNILHIDNAVEHLGLETNARFLEKTRVAIQTLRSLQRQGKIYPSDVRLLQVYGKLGRWGVPGLLRMFAKPLLAYLEKRLKKRDPRLWQLDVYKLVILATLR
ncbi:MAG: glycosyltransferase [Leptolyngbya sp. SIO3F4]|nr:glycosyltransferase [Leptolyngbya sp. SIO3F4]